MERGDTDGNSRLPDWHSLMQSLMLEAILCMEKAYIADMK